MIEHFWGGYGQKWCVASLVMVLNSLYLKNEQTEELIFCFLIQIHKN